MFFFSSSRVEIDIHEAQWALEGCTETNAKLFEWMSMAD